MADKKKYDIPEDKKYQYEKDYSEDWQIHSNYIQDFDAYEAMLISQVFDSVSRSTDGSKITDSYATTLAKERADRVIAKLPEGTTVSVGRADVGKAAFMDILRQKWIYPNANAQHPFLEKLNMWQLYSSVYGYMPMFYDWNVSPTGYVGPDCWLWSPRNLVPQQGRSSIADMDYVTALTWVSKKQLENWRKKAKEGDGWDTEALDLLIEVAERERSNQDYQKDTQVSRTRTPGTVRKGICLATRYEAGEDGNWCTFAPDHGYVQLREIPNPHKNGRIPFVIKYSQPLFDSVYGLGDFQRAKPLQFARDGLTNFYFTGIKNQLIPPLVANANGVVKHTLDYRAGGVILETLPNSVRTLDVGATGLNTYRDTQSALTGQILSLYGSQNASLPGAEALNPSQGKTPAAIGLYNDKEATRDGAELRHMEAAIEQLTDGFFSLVVNIGTEDIPVQLFAEDIEEINKAGLTDIMDMFFDTKMMPDQTGTAADLRVNPASLQGIEYRFNIEASSTIKQNKEKALDGLERLLGVIGKFQNLFKDDSRIEIDFPKILKSYEQFSDIKGASGFVKVNDGPSPKETALMQESDALKQALQQAQQQIQEQTAQIEAERQQVELDKRDAENQRQNEQTIRTVTDMAKTATAPQPEPQPTVNGSGQMFKDPELGKVADSITKM
jgi:hypothetical protein